MENLIAREFRRLAVEAYRRTIEGTFDCKVARIEVFLSPE
jgi:hypothetical protein